MDFKHGEEFNGVLFDESKLGFFVFCKKILLTQSLFNFFFFSSSNFLQTSCARLCLRFQRDEDPETIDKEGFLSLL